MKMPSLAASQKINALGRQVGNVNLLSQVKDSLLKREAILYEHDDIGVVIIKPTYHNGNIGMLVWLAIGSGVNVIETYLPLFEAMAKKTDMKFIMFETKRRGFSRFIKKFNFVEIRPSRGFFMFIKEV